MRCSNCNMDHVKGENRLCAGPFLLVSEHITIAHKLASQFYLMRNQYYHRLRILKVEPPKEDLDVIIGLQAEVERLG